MRSSALICGLLEGAWEAACGGHLQTQPMPHTGLLSFQQMCFMLLVVPNHASVAPHLCNPQVGRSQGERRFLAGGGGHRTVSLPGVGLFVGFTCMSHAMSVAHNVG